MSLSLAPCARALRHHPCVATHNGALAHLIIRSVDKVGLKQTIQSNDNDARARSHHFPSSLFSLAFLRSFFAPRASIHLPAVHAEVTVNL